jgi:hypothetical protein
MRRSIVSPIYKSIVRDLTEAIEAINAIGVFKTVEFHDFESRNDENALPRTTLLGIDGFSFSENGGLWIVRFALALSSYRDMNLHEEIELLDEIQKHYGEGQKINLLDMHDGSIANEMVVTQFEVMPMAQSEQRNYRVIGLEIKRTGTDS